MNWNDLKKEWLEKNSTLIVKHKELSSVVLERSVRKRRLGVWYKSNDGVIYSEFSAWEIDGEAYWEGSEPILVSTEPRPTFRNEATKALDELKKKGEIETYTFVSVDESTKNAIVITYTESAGTVQEGKKLIYEESGTLVIKDL